MHSTEGTIEPPRIVNSWLKGPLILDSIGFKNTGVATACLNQKEGPAIFWRLFC